MEYQTVAVTDYEQVTKTLARVVVSFTGTPSKKTATEMIQAKFNNLVAPVEGSFQMVKANVAVGFVRANKEIRVVEDQEIRANYRVMSSNIMMDNSDRSLWTMNETRGGKFLARHSQEDLGDLLEASVHRRVDIPALRHISMASAVRREFASFVDQSGNMDNGHVLAVSQDGKKVQVFSSKTRTPVTIEARMVTALSRPPLPKAFKAQMVKACISTEDKAQAKEYWNKLYDYDPDYLAMVNQQVEETTWL